MNGVDILKRCRSAGEEIRRLTEKWKRLEECATSVSSPLNSTGGSRSGVTDRVARFATEIDECRRAIAARRKRFDVELLTSCDLINRLTEPECSVIYRFYIQGQTVAEIAKALKYSEGYVKQVKRRGLDQIGAIPAAEIERMVPDWYR